MLHSVTKDALRPMCAAACLLALAGFALPTPSMAADNGGWQTSRGPAIDREAYHYAPLISSSRWDGFYLGLTLGYANGWTDVTGGSGSFDLDPSGAVGTVFGGYNWQLGNAVIGLEADIGTGSFDDARRAVASDLNSFGSLRGRVGYLVTPDFLIYATAGWAWADYDLNVAGFGTSETFSGYQVGAGTELKFADPWTLRLEYIYTDLGSETLNLGGLQNQFEPGSHAVRAGFAVQF